MSARRRAAASAPSPAYDPKAPWRVHFFKRHKDDDRAQTVPAREFLDACPQEVAAKIAAVVRAVADAPPPRFGGGGKWEAMHGEMSGIYEVRADGPRRHHYRLFCVLEREGATLGLGGPSVVLIAGKDKRFRTELSAQDYAEVRSLRDEYARRNPRSVSQ